ncbi:hypothetical protein EWU23_04930 [Cytophagaceae bacterium 50C-KIRBA]|uniref:MBOAT family protein n=1 Tax=Aquirufa beregesia TaxID=2516556 RepID=A0ABX0EUS1_9BACT|nr:MBOAT family O-acyltransferase [Aquirufa beregesia]NGZ43816.1 hypothetical protein [Aquirufa beregesia]
MAQIGLFSSIAFILVTISFSFIFRKQAWKALLIGSVLTLGFFMPLTLVLFLIGSGITYLIGNKIQSSFPWIGMGIGFLIGALIAYKLRESWINHISLPLENFWEKPDIWQVMGLSFFVFNAISYLMDIKRGFVSPAESFLKLTLYLIYFPTLHAGPLHRFKYLNSQFEQAKITEKSFNHGMRLILWGLFKNFVLAQRLNQLLISLKGSEIAGWWTLLIGFVFFFYIYFSFSSFIDFFQGVSEIFNIRLKDNFQKRIYFSTNRHEFWKGWHITLNEWFRDYFFYWQIKFKFWRNKPYLLLLLTYMLIGLWHGISWQYLLWGLLNGAWILLEKVWSVHKIRQDGILKQCLGIFYQIFGCSFIALVFIYPSLGDLWDKIHVTSYFPHEIWLIQRRNIFVVFMMFLLVDFYHLWSKEERIDVFLERISPWKRRLIYVQLVLSLFIFGDFSGGLNNYYLAF